MKQSLTPPSLSHCRWIDEGLWQRFHYYIYDEGSTGDQLCPKVEIADIAILFSAGKATIKQTEDGVLYYSYKSMSGTDQTIAPGRNLLQATLDDVNSRLEKGGLVWQQFLQPHVERIELVLDTVLGRRLDRLLRGGKITTAPQIPKTIPVLNFRPEDWADTVPCGFDSFAPDTPEAERTKLYYMLYSIAGKKLAGEVCTVPSPPRRMHLYPSISLTPSNPVVSQSIDRPGPLRPHKSLCPRPPLRNPPRRHGLRVGQRIPRAHPHARHPPCSGH